MGDIPDYKGYAITVNNRGHFAATPLEGDAKQAITKPTLSALKREIDKTFVAVPALYVESHFSQHIVKDVEVMGYGRADNWKVKAGGDMARWYMYLPNPEIAARLREIAAQTNALDQEWHALRGKLTPFRDEHLARP